MKRLLILCLIFISIKSNAQSSNYPEWFIKSFNKQKLNLKYELKPYLKPAFLQADFNGDKSMDCVALVIEKKTNKKGIVLIHGNSNEHFLFGAGIDFGNGGKDFKWLGGWQLYKDKIAREILFDSDGAMSGSKKVKLNIPAFYIFDLEDGQPNSGGIIYWNAKKYIWIHQGE